MKKELLTKYLNNQCTENELHEVFDWIKTEEPAGKGKEWGYETWNSYPGPDNDTVDDGNFYTIFEKIQKQIDKEIPSGNKSTKRSTLVFNILTKAAAVLLVPVLTFLFYLLSEKNFQNGSNDLFALDSLEVITPIGSRTVVQLSDGSEVHLNYGSKIKYPHTFSKDAREVILTGEGFFKVSHNPERPFIVKVNNLCIKAVGTTFNVSAYPGDDNIETTLVSGKVIMERVGKTGKVQNISTMLPGQHIDYNPHSGSVSGTEGSVEKYISWTEGKLVLDDTPILKVTEKLSKIFNTDFEINDKIKDYKYTVTFTDEPLYQILDLMALATPISYKILPRQKLPDGTYTKQKIILDSRQ